MPGLATTTVCFAIAEEREQQERKWGEQHHSYPYWFAVLMEEIGEAAEAMGRSRDLRKEMIQVAAVATQIAEKLDADEFVETEEPIFLELLSAIKHMGLTSRAVLDSRKNTLTGKATPEQAIALAHHTSHSLYLLRERLRKEVE